MAKSLFTLLKEGSTVPVFDVRDTGFYINNTLLFSDIIFHQEVIDPASIASNANLNITITIPGVAVGDFSLAAAGTDILDLTTSTMVVSPDTLTLNLDNGSGGAVDLPSSTWNFIILKR